MTTQPQVDVFTRRRVRYASPAVLAAVAVGGGLGSLARYGLAVLLPAHPGGFPVATFLTNAGGCLLLGVLMTLVLEVWPPNRYVRPFLGVGFLGGFTTFSTYTVELVELVRRGALPVAGGYAAASLAAGVLAAWAGAAGTRRLTHPREEGRAR